MYRQQTGSPIPTREIRIGGIMKGVQIQIESILLILPKNHSLIIEKPRFAWLFTFYERAFKVIPAPPVPGDDLKDTADLCYRLEQHIFLRVHLRKQKYNQCVGSQVFQIGKH